MVKQLNLCLANSFGITAVTTTKYIEYINSIQGILFPSRGAGKVLLWRHNQKPFKAYALLFPSCGAGKVLLWRYNQKLFTAYQHFDRHLL